MQERLYQSLEEPKVRLTPEERQAIKLVGRNRKLGTIYGKSYRAEDLGFTGDPDPSDTTDHRCKMPVSFGWESSVKVKAISYQAQDLYFMTGALLLDKDMWRNPNSKVIVVTTEATQEVSSDQTEQTRRLRGEINAVISTGYNARTEPKVNQDGIGRSDSRERRNFQRKSMSKSDRVFDEDSLWL